MNDLNIMLESMVISLQMPVGTKPAHFTPLQGVIYTCDKHGGTDMDCQMVSYVVLCVLSLCMVVCGSEYHSIVEHAVYKYPGQVSNKIISLSLIKKQELFYNDRCFSLVSAKYPMRF